MAYKPVGYSRLDEMSLEVKKQGEAHVKLPLISEKNSWGRKTAKNLEIRLKGIRFAFGTERFGMSQLSKVAGGRKDEAPTPLVKEHGLDRLILLKHHWLILEKIYVLLESLNPSGDNNNFFGSQIGRCGDPTGSGRD